MTITSSLLPLFMIIMAAWQRKWKWFIVVIAISAVIESSFVASSLNNEKC